MSKTDNRKREMELQKEKDWREADEETRKKLLEYGLAPEAIQKAGYPGRK